LKDGSLVNLCTIRDPVGEACIGAFAFLAGRAGKRGRRVRFEEVRLALWICFVRWNTRPEEVQTDNEVVFAGQPQDTFPTPFTLWLRGLGISHLFIRSGEPTDNAEVERCHRTVNDYAIVGNEYADLNGLQAVLDQAVYELCYELALFDLHAADAVLAALTWERKVAKTGQVTLGGRHQYYSIGRAYARRTVLVRFDPQDHHFVFFDKDDPDTAIRRRPATGLELEDLTGLAA
jgi:transposase InsO family protein